MYKRQVLEGRGNRISNYRLRTIFPLFNAANEQAVSNAASSAEELKGLGSLVWRIWYFDDGITTLLIFDVSNNRKIEIVASPSKVKIENWKKFSMKKILEDADDEFGDIFKKPIAPLATVPESHYTGVSSNFVELISGDSYSWCYRDINVCGEEVFFQFRKALAPFLSDKTKVPETKVPDKKR